MPTSILFFSIAVGAIAAVITFAGLWRGAATPRIVLHAGASFVAVSLLVWSFSRFSWYWPIIAVLVAFGGSTVFAKSRNVPEWMELALVWTTIVAGIYFWTAWWR